MPGVRVCSVVSNPLQERPGELQFSRLLCPWDSLGKNTGVGCQPSPEDLPDLGIKTMSPALAGAFFTAELPGKPLD